MRIRWNPKDALARVVASIAPILHIVLGSTAAYSISHYGLGHSVPLLAVTVTITTLGFTRDARPRRLIETAAGMVLGIALSEVLLLTVGQGVWQMALTLFVCLAVARAISGSASFALTVGIQAMLVHWLPAPEGGVFFRSIDGLIGGLTALAVTALIPRDPRRLAQKDAAQLFAVFLQTLGEVRKALVNRDFRVADAALVRVRRSQPLLDNWRMSLDSAVAISRISPFLRKHRDELQGQLRLMRGMDLATRNLRVIVRRIDFLMRDGVARPYLADLLEQIEDAVRQLESGLEEPANLELAQDQLLEIIHQLDPRRFGIADQLREASVLLLLRPMLVDLLCASGMHEDDARAELPPV